MNDRLQDATAGGDAPKTGFGKWIAGRARRREYWIWIGPMFVLIVVLGIVAPGSELLFGIPLLLIWIRRLHDLGWTGWLAPLINFGIGILGAVGKVALPADLADLPQGLGALAALILLGALPGQPRRNAYGPPPGLKDLTATFS